MPNVNDLKTSKFLTKNDVTPDVLVTFSGYEQINVAMENQPEELKYTFSFAELPKPLVMNSTNGQLAEMILGSGDFDDWIGKKVVLYNDPTISFGGRLTGGIRIRAPKNQGRQIADLPTLEQEEKAPIGQDTTDHISEEFTEDDF